MTKRRRRLTYYHRVSLDTGDSEEPIKAEARDISLEGIYVSVETDAIKLYDELSIVLPVGEEDYMRVPAKVVRVRKDAFGRIKGLGLQVQKEGLSVDWEQHVRSIESKQDE